MLIATSASGLTLGTLTSGGTPTPYDHSWGRDFTATGTSAGGINQPGPGPHRVVAGRIDSCKTPSLGPRLWPYLACQATLINNHNQRHMLTRKKQSNPPDTELETGAEPSHTCLNRTSHQERGHLLPTVVVSRLFGGAKLASLTSRRAPARPAEHHRSGLVRPGPVPSKQVLPMWTDWTPETTGYL